MKFYIILTNATEGIIITTIKNQNVTQFLDTFDYFVDDLLKSDVDLLNGELDFLIMQHLFNSVELEVNKGTESQYNDYLAA